MGVTAMGRNLHTSAVPLRDSLARMLAECKRSHRPERDERLPAPLRRVPTGRAGRAGADTLGQILGWNPSSQKGGATGS